MPTGTAEGRGRASAVRGPRRPGVVWKGLGNTNNNKSLWVGPTLAEPGTSDTCQHSRDETILVGPNSETPPAWRWEDGPPPHWVQSKGHLGKEDCSPTFMSHAARQVLDQVGAHHSFLLSCYHFQNGNVSPMPDPPSRFGSM